MMGFFMATTPRNTQTPGAKKETTTTAQTSTDDVMDAVLGKSKESDVVEDTQPVAPVRKKPVLTAKGWSVED